VSEAIFQRLFPVFAPTVDAPTYLEGLGFPDRVPSGRPLVLANFVSTLDGNATFDGRSSPLSDSGDRSLFHALRASADAILAGTGTLATEGYRPAGKPVVTLTRSGHLPTQIPLLQEPEGRVIAFSGQTPDLDGVGAEVSVEPLAELGPALATLRTRYGIGVLLCEGGPGLMGEMLRAGLVDELFLTLAAKLAGGSAGPSMTTGDPAPELISMQLASVLERENTLYLHYRKAG
jgi:riboflavin biosynthesis pyrimidine reductase